LQHRWLDAYKWQISDVQGSVHFGGSMEYFGENDDAVEMAPIVRLAAVAAI
jgi:hypothetical protein